MQIEDGTGGGYLAVVNSDNHLEVSAVTEDEMEWTSHNKSQAWNLAIGDIVTSASEIGILQLQYTGSTNHFHVRSIILACSGNGWFRIKTEGTRSGGVLLTNVNLNIGSGVVNTDLVCYGGSAAMTYAGGSLITSYYNSQQITYLGLIVGFSREICITHQGVDAGSLIGVSISGYIEEL